MAVNYSIAKHILGEIQHVHAAVKFNKNLALTDSFRWIKLKQRIQIIDLE